MPIPCEADELRLERQVRLLIADPEGEDALLSCEDIAGLLDLNDGHVLLAAADALDAIATTEALLSKKIRTQDRQTDGPAVAAELRKHANGLRARWREQEDAARDDSFFMISTPGASGRAEAEEWA